MGDPMRVLLLSANTGEGHNATAKAVMEVLEPRGVYCCLDDALAYLSPKFSKFISKGHVNLYRYSPKVFDAGYRFMERTADPEEFDPIYELLSLGANKLYHAIIDAAYDAVICVHPFSGLMVTEIRQSRGLHIPCYFVATDYTCCPTVEHCDLDGYFIPSVGLVTEFTIAGLPESRLLPTGIPVRQAFYERNDRQEARKALGLPTDKPIVLLMCGSMGCGPIKRVAKELTEQLPQGAVTVAVCGSNDKLYDSMVPLQGSSLRLLGFTTKIARYMDAADVIVTKPGGLSTTEAANKGLPMVLLNTVGGCESRNLDFFVRNGFAAGSDDPEQVVAHTVLLIRDEQRRLRMHQRLREHFTVNSAQAIAQHILEK